MSKLDFEKYISAAQALHGQAGYPFALFCEQGKLAWKNGCSESCDFFCTESIDSLLTDRQKAELDDAVADKKIYISALMQSDTEFSSLEFMPIYDNDKLVAIGVRAITGDSSQALVLDKESFSVVPKFLTLIREPMFNIFSIFSILEKKLEKNEMYEDYAYLKKAQKNCYKILKEATNLSELYKSILGQVDSKGEIIDLNAYLSNFVNAIALMFGNLAEKKIEITYSSQADVTPVRISEEHLSIALLNVILNSCMAQSGIDEKIEIKVSLKATAKNAIVTIMDNGYGIPKSELSRIFLPFTQGEDDTEKMGVGLNVVQAVLKNYGASCIVMSDEGEGANVSLKFPIVKPDETLKLRTNFGSYISDRLSFINIYLGDIFDGNLR